MGRKCLNRTPEQLREMNRVRGYRYWLKNKEKILQKEKLKRGNPRTVFETEADKRAAKNLASKKFRERNKDKVKDAKRKVYLKSKDKWKQYKKNYKEKYPEKHYLAKMRRHYKKECGEEMGLVKLKILEVKRKLDGKETKSKNRTRANSAS